MIYKYLKTKYLPSCRALIMDTGDAAITPSTLTTTTRPRPTGFIHLTDTFGRPGALSFI